MAICSLCPVDSLLVQASSDELRLFACHSINRSNELT